MHSYGIHFNPQPTTVNDLNKIQMLKSNVKVILLLFYNPPIKINFDMSHFKKKKTPKNSKFRDTFLDLTRKNEFQKISLSFQI